MYDFAEKLKTSSTQVIIAAAGGSTHLPGMLASLTTLPVIGLPIYLPTSTKGFKESCLYSMIDMPEPTPVAVVGINRVENALNLATRILAINDKELRQQITFDLTDYEKAVKLDNVILKEQGYQ